jgi:hypothetical protein
MEQKDYVKYTYWLEPDQAARFEKEIKSGGRRLRRARGVVCASLDPISSMTLIAPEVWNETCKRQGAWYRKSARYGRWLLVSPVPVQHTACTPNTIIRRSSFQSPGPASEEERARLLESRIYREQVPAEWPYMDASERKRWKVLFSKLKKEVDLNLLIEIHSANHANFLDPLFYLEEDGLTVPYSIDSSHLLCSCCLELYNVIGARFRKKLVRPCVGAVYFARLEADRFYEVTSSEGLE